MENLTFGKQRLVHIDLKGAPPKIPFFEKFFPFIKEIGATGILLEWEDTFPFTKELIDHFDPRVFDRAAILSVGHTTDLSTKRGCFVDLSTKQGDVLWICPLVSGAPYTLEEARQILYLAADCDLMVIPLVQTFGHMEYVLKHEQWRGLREVEAYPSSMCPSNSEIMVLVRSMIKQIVAFHNNIEYLHIGGDEIWHMGLCSVCQKRLQTSKFGKAGLYLDHVTEVAQFVRDNYPTLKIIIWDDMLRNIDLNILQDYYLGNLVEPMIWHYNSMEIFQLNSAIWEKYSNIFTNVWGATAFKGATSSSQLIPVAKYHISNHEAWLRELGIHAGKILNFRGIALTGWSRFDHYATMCELLPCGIPSLCLCLKTWLSGGYSQTLHDSVGKLLGYSDNFPSLDIPAVRPPLPLLQLSFPGWQVFVGIEWLVNIRTRYKNIINSDQMQTWFNSWQVSNNYTNPMQIDTILPTISNIVIEVASVESYLKTNLEVIFYNHTIDELIGTLILPMKQHLKQLQADCETQLSLGCKVRGHKRLNI